MPTIFRSCPVVRLILRQRRTYVELISIAFIFVVAIVPRLLFFFGYIYEDPKRSFYTIDSYTYEFPAINLLEKGKYINDCPRPIPEDFPEKCVPSEEPEIHRPPGYPIFIAIHYAVFGEKRETVIFSQNIIDSLKVILIYDISKKIGLPGPFAAVAGLAYALSPSAIVFSQTFMTETIQGFLVLLMVWLLVPKVSTKRAALCGVAAGALTMTHPMWFFLIFLLPIILFLFSKNLKSTVMGTSMAILIISGWILRNYLIWKIPIFRPGSDVFICEVRKKMYEGKWAGIGEKLDAEILNRTSERFGWGIKFDEHSHQYPLDLTKKTQIARVCAEDVLRRFWKYPLELHVAGFVRSFPPFGIAQIYYMTRGDISPSGLETTKIIIPYITEGKLKEALDIIKERRLKLLPIWLWFLYLIGWGLRTSTVLMSLISVLRPKRETFLLLFLILYGTLLVTTFESAQPRRFHTVDPIVMILATYSLNLIISRRAKSERQNIITKVDRSSSDE